MKTPSTSDLTHAQANTAYDRLAVISDHMPMLHELCDFIFDLQDWLKANQHKFLQEFVDNMNDELAKVKANLESLALTHDTDKIALQNTMNSINSNITNLTNLINQVDDKTVGLLIHNLNPSDDTHGATCMAIADYVSTKVAVLVGNLDSIINELNSIKNRLSALEARITELEKNQSSGGGGSGGDDYFEYVTGTGPGAMGYKTYGNGSESIYPDSINTDSVYNYFVKGTPPYKVGAIMGDDNTVYPYKNVITGNNGTPFNVIAHVFYWYVNSVNSGGTSQGGPRVIWELFTIFFGKQQSGTGYGQIETTSNKWIDNYVNNVIPTLPTGIGGSSNHGYKIVKGY